MFTNIYNYMAFNDKKALSNSLFFNIMQHATRDPYRDVYRAPFYLITALFEIRPVAYFGPKQHTFDQKTIFFLL